MRASPILASVLLALLGCSETPRVPGPDTSAMEPEVARKIGQAREEVTSDLGSAGRWGTFAMVLQAHGLYPEARDGYEVARRLDGRDFRWPYLQARCHLELQEVERAVEALGAALALEPAYAPLNVLEAELHEKSGRLDQALDAYRRALAIDPRSAAAELGVGRLLLEKGQIEESLEHFEKAAELQPGSGSIQALLSRALTRAGDDERARAAAKRARALPPEVVLDDRVMASVADLEVSLAGYQRRAAEAEARGEPRRAEELLRHIVSVRPEDADLHYNLANHLSRRERFAEAKESYEKALALDPGHDSALINLGILWSHMGELGEARQVFEKALSLSPDNPEVLASLAKVSALEGDTDAAIRLFHQALERAPDRPGFHLDLAVLYARTSDYQRAWRHVQESRELGLIPPEDFVEALAARMPAP